MDNNSHFNPALEEALETGDLDAFLNYQDCTTPTEGVSSTPVDTQPAQAPTVPEDYGDIPTLPAQLFVSPSFPSFPVPSLPQPYAADVPSSSVPTPIDFNFNSASINTAPQRSSRSSIPSDTDIGVSLPPPGLTFATKEDLVNGIIKLKNTIAALEHRLGYDGLRKRDYEESLKFWQKQSDNYASMNDANGVSWWQD
jgi:hypothetical protein